MSPEPIIEEPDDIDNPGTVPKASSNEITLFGNNTAQELAVLNASGKNDLAAIIAAVKVPERPAQVQRPDLSVVDFIPVVNVIKAGVDTGITCYQNNENRESYNQEVRQYHQTVREVAQKEVARVEIQCNTFREIRLKQCDTAIEIHKEKCKTWLAAKEKHVKNRPLQIQKNAESESQRIQQDGSIKISQLQADVQKDKERLNTELEKLRISECGKAEQHKTEKSTELAKEKVKLEETKLKNELELKALQENNALEVRRMEAEERKHERECAMGIERERIKLRVLELELGMNSNRRDSSNDPGTSSSSSTSSPQNENSSPPAFQSILIICYYNRNDSSLHYRLVKILAESRLCDVANYVLTSDESQSFWNAQIDNSASKLLKIPDNMNAQDFISILRAQERAPLDYFPGVSELNTIDIMIINGYCYQIKVHFG